MLFIYLYMQNWIYIINLLLIHLYVFIDNLPSSLSY